MSELSRYDIVRAVARLDPYEYQECIACGSLRGMTHHRDCWWAAARRIEGKVVTS